MAVVRFSELNNSVENSTNSNFNNSNSVSFFSLRNDGDEAIVRFMYDSTDEFDILTTHEVEINGKHRKINCLRDAKEPLNKCPFCAAGEKVRQNFFIKLIQYAIKDDGTVVAEPKIWERSFVYANTLANLINEYGPLTQSVFKIKRDGKPGDMSTKYNIMYASPAVYKPELYPYNPSIFGDYSVIGSLVIDETFDDANYFIETGKLPDKKAPTTTNNDTFVSETPVANTGINYSNTYSTTTRRRY